MKKVLWFLLPIRHSPNGRIRPLAERTDPDKVGTAFPIRRAIGIFVPIIIGTANCLLPVWICSQTWNSVGTANYVNPVYSLKTINNELYVGGDYSPFPSPSYINIAKWNGITWVPVDSAKYGDVRCFLEYNGELYIAGNFGTVGSINAPGIAKWDGTQWSTLGIGIQGGANYINDLEVFNGDVYAAGHFNKIGNVNTYGIGKWNGSAWSAVGGGLLGGSPSSDGQALLYKNDLYVGGDFTMAGNVPANGIARWNGTQWDSVSEGVPGEVLALVVDTINDFLYAGGRFLPKGIAKWDGFAWTTLDSGITADVYSLTIYHNQLYAVGALFATGGEGVARWNGIYWEAVGGGTTPGGNTVFSSEVYKDELYVGGGFTDAGGDTSIKYIARWYSPPDTTCKFLQPIIESMNSLSAPNGVADTFYYTDSVAVQFYNNIASASSWQWDFDDGDTASGKTPAHYYSTAGTYTVSVIVNYPWGPYGPCIDTAYKVITVINNTGVNDPETSSGLRFKVYPNPAKREINIEVTGDKGRGTREKYIVRIKNSLGQKMIQHVIPSGARNLTIDTSKFPNGLYLVEVCTAEGEVCHTEKVVVE